MQNSSEILAMIQLLDDPDERVYNQIRTQLLDFGPQVIPQLEQAWEDQTFGLLFQERVEHIIHTIQLDTTCESLHNWASSEQQDLLEGLVCVARYQYPDLDVDHVYSQIEQIRQDVWLELNDDLTALEKVKVLNHIFFTVHGFSGNTTNYHAPQNSFINTVLESKKGNPISLAVIYLIVAQQLEIPIYGVNLPKHFILGYIDDMFGITSEDQDADHVLFYINPFSKGAALQRSEIEFFLRQLNLEPNPDFFQPCTNLMIIKRMLKNLEFSFERLGYSDKVEEVGRLLGAIGH